MWRKGFTKYVPQINSDSFRIQSVKFNFPGADLLVFNLYFMVDPHNNLVNDNELMTLLAEIDRIINVTHCRNILLAGDINCDFSMYTQQVKIIRDFVDNKNKNLNIFWNLPDISETQNISIGPFNYSNTVKNVTHSSTIDHYIGNNRLYSAIIEANVINSVNNLCNHLPMYCKYNMNMLNLTVC